MQVNTLKEACNESGNESATPFFTLYDFKKYLKVFCYDDTVQCALFLLWLLYKRDVFFKHGFVLLGGVAQYFFKLKSTQ